MSAQPLSGARITARALFAAAVAFFIAAVVLVISPVHATIPSSSPADTISCGAVAVSGSTLFELRNDAQQQTQENDSSDLAAAIAQLRGETHTDPYIKYDACQQALGSRKPWAWSSLGLMLLTLFIAIVVRISARTRAV